MAPSRFGIKGVGPCVSFSRFKFNFPRVIFLCRSAPNKVTLVKANPVTSLQSLFRVSLPDQYSARATKKKRRSAILPLLFDVPWGLGPKEGSSSVRISIRGADSSPSSSPASHKLMRQKREVNGVGSYNGKRGKGVERQARSTNRWRVPRPLPFSSSKLKRQRKGA